MTSNYSFSFSFFFQTGAAKEASVTAGVIVKIEQFVSEEPSICNSYEKFKPVSVK